jgi:hypothetical protein
MSEPTHYIGQQFISPPPYSAKVWANENHAKIISETLPTAAFPPQPPRVVWTIIEDPNYVSPEKLLKEYENAIQDFLDKTAQSKGYDNTYTCLSYLNSTVEKWKTESNKFLVWRDEVWTKVHAILDEFNAGKIPQPSLNDVIEQLPKIDW